MKNPNLRNTTVNASTDSIISSARKQISENLRNIQTRQREINQLLADTVEHERRIELEKLAEIDRKKKKKDLQRIRTPGLRNILGQAMWTAYDIDKDHAATIRQILIMAVRRKADYVRIASHFDLPSWADSAPENGRSRPKLAPTTIDESPSPASAVEAVEDPPQSEDGA